MSVFTSRVTRTVSIPHDPEHSVTYRKLAPRHLEAAAKVAQLQAIETFKAMGAAEVMKQIEGLDLGAIGAAAGAATAAAVSDPMNGFDRATLIEKGVLAWTYDVPPKPEHFEDLDDETQEFLAREVLKLAKPSLFQTPSEQEAAQKNA